MKNFVAKLVLAVKVDAPKASVVSRILTALPITLRKCSKRLVNIALMCHIPFNGDST